MASMFSRRLDLAKEVQKVDHFLSLMKVGAFVRAEIVVVP